MNDNELGRLLLNECEICGEKLWSGMCMDHTKAERVAVLDAHDAHDARDQPKVVDYREQEHPEPFDTETLLREMEGALVFAGGTSGGRYVPLADFTRVRIARALDEGQAMIRELTDRLARIDTVMRATAHDPRCKPWRAKNWPDDPAICVCQKADYESAIAGR